MMYVIGLIVSLLQSRKQSLSEDSFEVFTFAHYSSEGVPTDVLDSTFAHVGSVSYERSTKDNRTVVAHYDFGRGIEEMTIDSDPKTIYLAAMSKETANTEKSQSGQRSIPSGDRETISGVMCFPVRHKEHQNLETEWYSVLSPHRLIASFQSSGGHVFSSTVLLEHRRALKSDVDQFRFAAGATWKKVTEEEFNNLMSAFIPH